MTKKLKDLFNSKARMPVLKIESVPTKVLIRQLKDMLFIRMVEQHIAKMRRDGLIKGPVHLSVGQEAIAVGISHNLKKTDYVFGAHRSHSHILALGASLHHFFAEILGKSTGLSHGMGGSMHLQDKKNGFYGSVPIVAGTVPIALGSAIAAKFKKSTNIAVSYLGDGACEEGVVHESLNLAKILNLPVLFIVENNLFASHMHISLRQPNQSTARFAKANNIQSKVIDGNDIVEIQKAAELFIKDIRKDKGPRFLELVTYRWFGHVDWREDVDVGINRSQKDLKNWKNRDPIQRLKQALTEKSLWDNQMHLEITSTIKNDIDKQWANAMEDPYPKQNSLTRFLYSN